MQNQYSMDILKLQEKSNSKCFCCLFYLILIVDLIILIFSISFFIIPFQQQEYEQQYLLEKASQKWIDYLQNSDFQNQKLNLNISYMVYDELQSIQQEFLIQTQDPFYNYTNYTALFEIRNLSKQFGQIEKANMIGKQSEKICLQLLNSKVQLEGQNYCKFHQGFHHKGQQGQQLYRWIRSNNDEEFLPYETIIPSINGSNYYYLFMACFIFKYDIILNFMGGCLEQSGLLFRKLNVNQTYNFEETSIFIRNINDPYLIGINISQNYTNPMNFNKTLFPTFINNCFVGGFAQQESIIMI
ncbi:hypothetical protein pb186bvf_004734 [Paramecium bursaria]